MDAGAIAVLIPIVAVGGFFTWMISLSPLGKAFAERLRHGPVPPPDPDVTLRLAHGPVPPPDPDVTLRLA